MEKDVRKIGIDAISYYLAPLYLPIVELARARRIEPAKLGKGLGLEKMALCDVDQDAATMGAEAVVRLIEENDLNPSRIGRIYLATESGLDAAKPTATYIAQMVEAELEKRYGERSLKNCDVLDMTFACVAGVDALQNSVDWVGAGENRQAVVVASDVARYDLDSTGEYTQGAGAVAILIKENPRLTTIEGPWGVAMESVGDFFKPHPAFRKDELLERAARLLGASVSSDRIKEALQAADDDFWGGTNRSIQLHRDEPVFDGQYSNRCYTDRLVEAIEHFGSQRPGFDLLDRWDYLVFHLPYAYQGRRMILPYWIRLMIDAGNLPLLEYETGMYYDPSDEERMKEFTKKVSKTPTYKQFVSSRIEKTERASSQIGNLYTASIFMALVSLLVSSAGEKEDLSGKRIGCLGYGSGSKSKVFEMEIAGSWRDVARNLKIFEDLEKRTRVDFETYEKLHSGSLVSALVPGKRFSLKSIGSSPGKKGYRYY